MQQEHAKPYSSIRFAASCMLTGLFVHGDALLSAGCMHAGDGLVRVWRVARVSQASNSLLGTMRGAHALHSVSALSLDKAHNRQVCSNIPDCCQGGYYLWRDSLHAQLGAPVICPVLVSLSFEGQVLLGDTAGHVRYVSLPGQTLLAV